MPNDPYPLHLGHGKTCTSDADLFPRGRGASCKPAVAVFWSHEDAQFDKSSPLGVEERLDAGRIVLN